MKASFDEVQWIQAQRLRNEESVVFWKRFSDEPDFAGKDVLEVGCGLGGLCVDIASRGASNVLGIDIRDDDIEFARRFAEREVPELAERISFSSNPLSKLPDREFDYIISKDAFEHIIDVDGMLDQIRRHLKRDGEVYIGFSPLYHSPYGDHDRRRTAFASLGIVGRLLAVIPWGHLLLERQILKRHSELRGESLASMHDLNLNKLKVGEFRDKVVAAGFEIDSLRFNQGSSKIGKIFAVGRRLPGMETYCTYNLYCKLRYAVDSSK